MNQAELKSVANRYLQFNLGSELYAIPLLQVKEVIGRPEVTPIPYSPTHFLGVMNLRGQVISIIDLRKKLNVKPGENTTENAVVILDLGRITLGCVVDSVNSVMLLEPDQIQPDIELEGGKRVDYLLGVSRADGKLTAILDIGKLLSIQDMNSIQKAGAPAPTKAA